MKRMEMSPYGYPTVYYCVQTACCICYGVHPSNTNGFCNCYGAHPSNTNGLCNCYGAHPSNTNGLCNCYGTHPSNTNGLCNCYGVHPSNTNDFCNICNPYPPFIKKEYNILFFAISKKRLRRYIRPPNNWATTKSMANHNTLYSIFLTIKF